MALRVNDLGQVLTGLFPARTKWYYIGLELAVPVDTLESIKSENKDDLRACLSEMLLFALRSTNPELTWKRIIEALNSVVVGEEQLAVSLEEKYVQKGTGTVNPTNYEDELRNSLSDINRWEDMQVKDTAKEGAISFFISRSIKSDHTLKHIIDEIQRLYSEEMLISEELFAKAQQLAAEEYANKNSTNPNSATLITPTKSPSNEPLFCKDTIYHAGICCQAVSGYTAGDYQKFFKDEKHVPGHAFKAVSFSRSKEEGFVIAQKGESTYYFAFKGRPNLSDWTKGLKSFNEGIMAQCGKFPIRYIIELLIKQRHIVLTGFSFGGLVASAVAACVWDTPYISSDLLKENMTCITFGQPLVSVDIVQKVVVRRPEMKETIHAIFTEQDQIPSLMSLLDECWSERAHQSKSKSTSGVQVSVPVKPSHTAPFQDQATFDLLQKFAELQKLPESHKIIEDIKSKSHEMMSSYGGVCKQFSFSFTQHLISIAGLTSTSESKNVTSSQVQSLTTTIYNEHSMFEYCKSVFEYHLDKFPKYSFPETPRLALEDVHDLKPSLCEVQIHHHGNETAMVIEGSNLWFCYAVSFRKLKLSIPASDVSGSSIQFTRVFFPGYLECNKDYDVVSLDNHFKSKPIKWEVKVFEKKYSTTTRQAQLAKLTPSKVIELGYLSALLEQCGTDSDGLHTHKFEVIKTFLEDVVRVVPFESIAYAIANGNYQTAMQRSKALMATAVKIPKTVVMYTGLLEAVRHLMLGVPTSLLHSLEFEALEKDNLCTTSDIYMESGKLVYLGHRFLPGTQIPLQPVKVQTGVKYVQQVNKDVARELIQLRESVFQDNKSNVNNILLTILPIVSKTAIEELYPIHSDGSSCMKSPLNILVDGRKRLAALSVTSSRSHSNEKMLNIVNTIRNNELDICTSLLGGFMHQSVVNIGLSTNKSSPANILVRTATSIGVWALFSLDYDHVQPILSQCQDEHLLVKLYDYVKGISGITHEPDESDFNPYAAKLQFMVQGMTKTVTCNTRHVSYSLERQLVELCDERSIRATTPVSEITGKWSVLFKEKTLSLVHHKCRLLIAQWLKWALMIHNLREELAKYTAVGVVGLVNSGKSKLVNTIFGIKIPTGTTESKRTTVPFLYNLDEKVEGLNVVDFPGVDDEDDSIGDLADLLLTVAQIIVFVVDYRKVHTQSAKKWLERLQKEKVPTLVCLTFGDKLYAEHMTTTGKHPRVEDMSKVIKSQTTVTREKLRSTGSHQIQFFSFCQDKDSVLNSDSGRKKLREVGIGTPLQVGEWLVKVFREDFKQNELASQLEVFVDKNTRKVS